MIKSDKMILVVDKIE